MADIERGGVMQAKHPLTVLYAGSKKLAPGYATEYSAGADLKAHIKDIVRINPGERVLIPTGIRLEIPHGWEGQIRPRSGLALKKGITLLNSPGTIDSDYRGEIKVILINLGQCTEALEPGERIAQIVMIPVAKFQFEHCSELSETTRGVGGFGSTGT